MGGGLGGFLNQKVSHSRLGNIVQVTAGAGRSKARARPGDGEPARPQSRAKLQKRNSQLSVVGE